MIIFTIVKNTIYQAIVLAFVFVMPMAFTSLAHLGGAVDTQLFFENCSKQGKSKEKESDLKHKDDKTEAFVCYEHSFTDAGIGQASFYSGNKELGGINKDVVTPPPEFS